MQNQKQKNGEAAKTKQVGTEPPGGASKTQANGQTDSSTAGQGSSSGFTGENNEPTIQSESMADVSSGNAEPEGGVSSASELAESGNSEPTEARSGAMYGQGNDSESGAGVGVSSMVANARQKEAEPMSNASERVQIGHTASANAVPQSPKKRNRNVSQQSTAPSHSHTQTRKSANSQTKRATQKTTDSKPSSSERVRIGHGIEPPTKTEKTDNK